MNDVIIIESIYALILILCSVFIYRKVQSLYAFSKYRGLKYYAKAFLFIAIGFGLRYAVMVTRVMNGDAGVFDSYTLGTLIMEFFLVLPGLFLFYSMIWQTFEKERYLTTRSGAELTIYALAFIIALGDTLLHSFWLMYGSQVLLFGAVTIISFRKYLKNKNTYLQLFTVSMALLFIVWIGNLVSQYTILIIPTTRLYVYLLTATACIILLYVTLRLAREGT